VNQPPKTASEWTVESRNCTLAEDNPNYPADAPVVVVCFVDDLLEYGPPFDPTEQTELSLSTLNETGVHYFTFPAPRLTVLESPATGLTDTESTTTNEATEPTTSATTAEDSDTDLAHTTEQPVIETEDDSDADTGPSSELQQLKATLEDNDLDVIIEDTETLAVERLGQTYYIRPGEVEGDGALRSRLETILTEAG
jgi:hypothetical protein